MAIIEFRRIYCSRVPACALAEPLAALVIDCGKSHNGETSELLAGQVAEIMDNRMTFGYPPCAELFSLSFALLDFGLCHGGARDLAL